MPDEPLRSLLSYQHGLITSTQAADYGLTNRALRWRVASGRWQRIHPGVYQTHTGDSSWLAMATAAVLALGPQASLSHHSAAHLWGLTRQPPELLTVMVPHDRRIAARPGIEVVRDRHAAAKTHETAWPWRTTIPETLLDVGSIEPLDRMLALVAYACQREVTTAAAIRQALDRRRSHRWTRALHEVLADVADGTQSVAEIRYVRDVERAHGLPLGERQMLSPIGEHRFHDNGYRELRLIVEIDGRAGHQRWDQRRRDARRDTSNAGIDWLTLRYHWPDVAVTPCATAREIALIAASRGWTSRPRPCRRRDCDLRGFSWGGGATPGRR